MLTTTNILVGVPAGAVTQTVTLIYTDAFGADGTPPGGNFVFAGRAFTLTALQGGEPQQGFVFLIPVTVTLDYTNPDVIGLIESQIQIYYYDADTGTWLVDGVSVIERDVDNNRIAFTILHLTRFASFAPSGPKVFLPLITRDNLPVRMPAQLK